MRGKRCGGTVHGIISPSGAVEIEICDDCAGWTITAHGHTFGTGRSLNALCDAIPRVLVELRKAGHTVAATELDRLAPAFTAHRNP